MTMPSLAKRTHEPRTVPITMKTKKPLSRGERIESDSSKLG